MAANHLNKKRIQEIIQVLPALLGQQPELEYAKDSVRHLLADYFRLVEIAHYVRRGGIKAMIYRLEIGKTELVDFDYFDEAHERLTSRYRQLYTTAEANTPPLIERLREMHVEEEDAVREFLPQLDALLLQDKRLEAVSSDEQ
jgi:hypothetical protein